MITDNELKTLFEQESKEHLDALESGVLALEKTPAQPELHETVMREAHSLKGAARMLGLNLSLLTRLILRPSQLLPSRNSRIKQNQ